MSRHRKEYLEETKRHKHEQLMFELQISVMAKKDE